MIYALHITTRAPIHASSWTSVMGTSDVVPIHCSKVRPHPLTSRSTVTLRRSKPLVVSHKLHIGAGWYLQTAQLHHTMVAEALYNEPRASYGKILTTSDLTRYPKDQKAFRSSRPTLQGSTRGGPGPNENRFTFCLGISGAEL